MSNEPPQDDPESKPWLPPELSHLGFLCRPPDTTDLGPKEAAQVYRERVAAFEKHAAELDRHHVPYQEILTIVRLGLAEAEACERMATATGDELLHAMADLADAQSGTAKIVLPLAERWHAEEPFDPVTQEIKEYADELRKQVPKDL